jgi:hypothetical protein
MNWANDGYMRVSSLLQRDTMQSQSLRRFAVSSEMLVVLP